MLSTVQNPAKAPVCENIFPLKTILTGTKLAMLTAKAAYGFRPRTRASTANPLQKIADLLIISPIRKSSGLWFKKFMTVWPFSVLLFFVLLYFQLLNISHHSKPVCLISRKAQPTTLSLAQYLLMEYEASHRFYSFYAF